MTAILRADLLRRFFWNSEPPSVPPGLAALLAHASLPLRPWHRPDGEAAVPPPALEPGFVKEAESILGTPLHRDAAERLLCSRGLSTEDLVRARLGDIGRLPDAIAKPAGHGQVVALLDLCDRAGVAVVPRGGGTSVTGAVTPTRGGLVLDLVPRMGSVLEVNAADGLIRAQAGILGPALEAAAEAAASTVGHFPQSFQRSTLGGWLAARSAGQLSSRYGRADQMVVGVRAAAPAGEIAIAIRPAAAEGPDLLQSLVGSEGGLAVITEATLRVLPCPERRLMAAFLAPGFAAGLAMARQLARDGVPPAALRVHDEEETSFHLAVDGRAGFGRAVVDRLAGRGPSSLVVVVAEGARDEVSLVRRRVYGAALAQRALPLGSGPAAAWWKNRFHHPALRDALLEQGVLVETMETSVPWSRVAALCAEVRAELCGACPLVGAHVSHVYPDGASVYFTFFLGPAPGQALDALASARDRVAATFVRLGCPLSHHHGIGKTLVAHARGGSGAGGRAALAGLKRGLDPHGIMNPGTLLDG